MMILEGKCLKINQTIITCNRRRQNKYVLSGPLEISMRVAEAREIEMLFFWGGGEASAPPLPEYIL